MTTEALLAYAHILAFLMAATFLAIFFVPLFYAILYERRFNIDDLDSRTPAQKGEE